MSTTTPTNSLPTSDTPAAAGPRFTLRHFSALLIVIGLLITGYMTYNKLVDQPMMCIENSIFNCAKVENSAWAHVGPIPTAMLGLIAHTLLGTVLFLEWRGVSFFKENGSLLMFGMTLFFIFYHSYLIYISVFVIQALCMWCLAAATTMFIQFFTTVVRMRRQLPAA